MARTKITADDLQDSLLTQIQTGGVGASSNTQILFNDSGYANGSNTLTLNKTTGTLTAYNILPAANNTYSLGNSSIVWKDIYIGPGSLYINGKEVLSESANTIIISTNINQGLALQTSGTGGIVLDPQGTGSIQIKNTLQILAGKSITSSDGSAIGIGNPIAVDIITSKSANADLTLTANGSGSVRITDDLIVSGNIIFTGTAFTVNTQTVSISDNIIDLNSDFTTGTPTENAGIRVIRGDEVAVILRWNESLDHWEYTNDGTNYNILGQKGDKGEIGNKGDKGEKGDVEAQGAKGEKGDKGVDGTIGVDGAKGDKGVDGTTGVDGAKGDKGVDGTIGVDGTKGDKGDIGATGSKGDTGITGDKGDIGATGSKGDKGVDGTIGAAGDKGDIGATGSKGDIGVKGDPGVNGGFSVTLDSFTANGSANSFQLSTTPVDENHIIVVIGGVVQLKDSYILNGANVELTEAPANTDVVEITTLNGGIQGDKGDTGSKGDKGDIGATGNKGDTGATGSKGDKGDTGDKGDIGATGSKGDKGVDGTIGVDGAKGDKGNTGITGDKGDTGGKGDKGDIGATGDKGDTGSKGDKGEVGTNGDKGDTGSKGDKGVDGTTGAAGDKGDIGATGSKGDKGVDGTIGVDGAKGDKGDTGSKGDKGEEVSSATFTDANNTLTFTNSDATTFDVTGVKGQKGEKGTDSAGGGGGGGAFGITVNSFTANGTSNTYGLSVTPLDENHITVVIDGITQLKSAYNVSANTLTLAGNPSNGSVVEVSTFASAPLANGLYVTVDSFTGNGAANVFTLSTAPANENYTFVSVNGILQHKNAYSVSGSSLMLSENIANNDAVEVVTLAGGIKGDKGEGGTSNAVLYTYNILFGGG